MAVATRHVKQETQSAEDINDRIRLRAYELFELRGCENGRDFDDWLRAEAEITGKTRKLASLSIVK